MSKVCIKFLRFLKSLGATALFIHCLGQCLPHQTLWALSVDQVQAGQHYQALDPQILQDYKIKAWVNEHPDKIWCLEFFSYYCPACNKVDGILQTHLTTQIQNQTLIFEQVPISFRPAFEILARAYYLAHSKNNFQKIHQSIFNGILQEHIALSQPDNLKQFFMLHGFNQAEFEQNFNGFPVQVKLMRARSLENLFKISATPFIFLIKNNQGFSIDIGMSGSFENLPVIIQAIMAQLH